MPFASHDFEKSRNAIKWNGVFVSPLRKVLEQVHPSLRAKEDALEYIESLIIRLLKTLCSQPCPNTVADVEERVRRTFPTPIDKWAINDAKDALEKGKKKGHGLVLPVEKLHHLLQKDVVGHKIDSQVTLYIVAVLEYIAADILKLVGNYVKNIRHVEIACQDIRVAMCADKVLMDMFSQEDSLLNVENEHEGSLILSAAPLNGLTYEKVAKDLLQCEKQHLRNLHMIIKVFREEICRVVPKGENKAIDSMFNNVLDLHDLSVIFLGSLEDVFEMTDENQQPALGFLFEELAEAAEFDVFSRYAKELTSSRWLDALVALADDPCTSCMLQSAGQAFKEAVKYYLPKLIIAPLSHCLRYFEYINALNCLSANDEDRESLKQVEGVLKPIHVELSNPDVTSLIKREALVSRNFSQTRRQHAQEKRNELLRILDGWDATELAPYCNEFIREGDLKKWSNKGKPMTGRRVILFDGVLLSCKPITKRTPVPVPASLGGSTAEYRLKEKFFIRRVEITDCCDQDNEDLKNALVISPRGLPAVILVASTPEERNGWMADLIMLNTKSMLDRILDSFLLDEEKKHPLRLPPPSVYRFSEEDSTENIVLEEVPNSGVYLIKGGTLIKLVERLTYHIHADANLLKTFLTTYRSFCTPRELLNLLIERFNIPDPFCEGDELDKNLHREDSKRFREIYSQPVQFRVLNVLRHWVAHHYYDFENDPALLEDLKNFLEGVRVKSMRKWVPAVTNLIQRRSTTDLHKERIFAFNHSPPPIEWHIDCPIEEWTILTLHPIELARQLTLLEFDLFRVITPSELVGTEWTKKDKKIKSPNLLKMIRHSTVLTLWIEKSIMETGNFEERVAMVSRVIEIITVLQDLNNFCGVMAVTSALCSAAVHRLIFTFDNISARLLKAKTEAEELSDDHFKKYYEKLRSINPPCVPFFGMYLTNIVHIEEGNSDTFPSQPHLINFSKWRRVAQITQEIQQYQCQPYCLSVEPRIRAFLENLKPFEDMSDADISTYLHEKSLELEPRNATRPTRFPRKWPDLNLKSPGVKPKSLSRHKPPLPLVMSANSAKHNHHNSDSHDDSPTPDTAATIPATPRSFHQGSLSHGVSNASLPSTSRRAVFSQISIKNKKADSPGALSTSTTDSCLTLLAEPLSSATSPSSDIAEETAPPPPLPPRGRRPDASHVINSHVIWPDSTPPILPLREPSPPPLPPRIRRHFSNEPSSIFHPHSLSPSAHPPPPNSPKRVLSSFGSSSTLPPGGVSGLITGHQRMMSCGLISGTGPSSTLTRSRSTSSSGIIMPVTGVGGGVSGGGAHWGTGQSGSTVLNASTTSASSSNSNGGGVGGNSFGQQGSLPSMASSSVTSGSNSGLTDTPLSRLPARPLFTFNHRSSVFPFNNPN